MGAYHVMSIQHLDRYVREFTGRHNAKDRTIAAKLAEVVIGLIGKTLMYRDLTGTTAAEKLAKATEIGLAGKRKPIKTYRKVNGRRIQSRKW